MTPEHLDLYRKLSETKIYRERFEFDGWRSRDLYYCPYTKEYGFIFPLISVIPCCNSAFWLPPVFDPENPQRCLWGMVDWKDIPYIEIDKQGMLYTDQGTKGCLDIALINWIIS